MRRWAPGLCAVVALALVAAACGSNGDSSANGTTSKATTVRLLSHDSFAASPSVLAAFRKKTGIKIAVVRAGDAGAALNQAVLTKGKPLGDVFFGVDNTFLSRALDAGIFEPYAPAALSSVPGRFELDPTHHVVPIDYGDVCVNLDKKRFATGELPAPKTFDDLADPRYKDMLVVENPATSSPGLAFLLATIAHYGDGWQDYWRRLATNGMQVVDGWEAAYNASFSGGSGKGARPLVVSYGSSPPAEVYYADPKPAEAPTAVLEDTCFRQVEFAGVLRGTKHRDAARQVVDFLLSKELQADVALQMFVYPVRDGVALPDVFTKYAAKPASPLTIPASRIGAERDRWIQQWTALRVG